jgi:hypothetical protein
MIKRLLFLLVLFCLLPSFSSGDQRKSAPPDKIVIARDIYFDFGPPFDYYEIISIKENSNGLAIDRALITPPSNTCFELPHVETTAVTIPSSMAALLDGRNPCDIPEKDLLKEKKRCKNCLNFSGVRVMMQVSCGAKQRIMRMDVLDRDLFDKHPDTPKNTSWTMGVMSQLDKALGPGAMEKPAFGNLAPQESAKPDMNLDIVKKLREGIFDNLFASKKTISSYVTDAGKSITNTSVAFSEAVPLTPLDAPLPNYPPIAKAAHVEGTIKVDFDVTPEGNVRNISFPEQGLMVLRDSTSAAIAKWIFPPSAETHHEHGAITFRLNCNTETVKVSGRAEM